MNRGDESVESLIGANIRSGLLAANVLLARRQCKNESAPAGRIGGLTRESPRHLPHVFIVSGDDAHKRAAVAGRNAEALTFQRDDVGFHWRL